MKIKNAKKFILSTSILFIFMGLLLLIISSHSFSYRETKYLTVYASSGDTLWKIAENQQINNKYYENKDIRYIINDIKDINNISQSNLSVGQEIKIPY